MTPSFIHHYLGYDLAENPFLEQFLDHAGTVSRNFDLLQRTIRLNAPHWLEIIHPGGYDAAGNLLLRYVQDSEGPGVYGYVYDDLYQLISESGIYSHTYQNDSGYNRIAKDLQHYEFNALNQLMDHAYRYDLNGNLIKKEGVQYRYDALDRLIEVNDSGQITQYSYDFSHRRLSKIREEDTTRYLYQGQNEIAAIENGKITQLRVLGISHGAEIGAAVALELNGETYVPIHDPYGNVVSLLDTSGNPIETYRYSAFGEIQIFSEQALDNPWRYSSKRYDPETGFIYFGRRYYSPDMGRWVTPDPLGFADGPNLYTYLHNHPFAYIDPDGQFAFLLPIAISLAAEYCLPVATLYLQQYAGGALAAAFLTGMVGGYNGSVLETSALGSTDASCFVAEKVGACIGTALQFSSPKGWIKGGSAVATNLVGREVVHGATNVVTRKASQAWNWFSQNLTRKTAPQAGQSLARNVNREYGAVKSVGQIAQKEVKLDLDALSKAGQVIDRGGLTKAGRALDKHAGRSGSAFPKIAGNSFSKNIQGQHHLEDILTHPQSRIIKDGSRGFEIYVPDGRGAYFRNDGSFRGFIENK